MGSFDVIIPAGGHLDSHFAGVVGTNSKPLIHFKGVTILRRTVEAFKATGLANRIVVVGTEEVNAHRDAELADFSTPEQGTSPKNIVAGLRMLETDGSAPDRVLICTADLPFVTPDSIKNFVAQTSTKDFYAPLIAEDAYMESFPGCPATFVRLRDGSYTAGCLYNADTQTLKRCLEYIEQVFHQRKSKLGMANILGVGFTMKYLLKLVTVADVEKRVSELLHCSATAIPESSPDLAFDIDYIEDYQYALQNYDAIQRGKWEPVTAKQA